MFMVFPTSEETSEDVRVRLCTVQESEHRQLRDLTAFLDAHLNFAKQCVEVLGDVKAEWVDTYVVCCLKWIWLDHGWRVTGQRCRASNT